jgi:hypothetical protein
MSLSKIKSTIVNTYNYLIFLLPVKLANRFIWVNSQVDWSISIYEGNNYFNLKPTITVENPVMSRRAVNDAVTAFVADPFMIRLQSEWLMFFEVFNQKRQKGEISFAQSKDGYRWNYQHIILSEEFHLSYPYVFEFESNWYMIPETCEANSVRLYQAKKFPQTWDYVSEILVGKRFVDASILNFHDMWWIFVGVAQNDGDVCNTLELYYADHLLGDWIEHPMSPIVSNSTEISRPAGRVRNIDDRLIRFTQDCTTTYGYNVTAVQIETLTKTEYREKKIQTNGDYLFELGTMACNKIGMHHIDFIMLTDRDCIACVDSR